MLLISDRSEDAVAYLDLFNRVCPSEIVTPDTAKNASAGRSLIVCHVNMADSDTRQRVGEALTHHRATHETPVLFLVPRSDKTVSGEALALGATEVLPDDVTPRHLLFTLKRMSRRRSSAAATRGPRMPGTEGRHLIGQAGKALTHLLNAAVRQEPLSATMLEDGADALIESIKKTTVKEWLDIVRRYDDITFQHSLLVAGLVATFSVRLGYIPSTQRQLAQAALIHDIGKARIPSAILNKPGALSLSEQEIMRHHPVIGHDMLARQGVFEPAILNIVRHHHEYLDGSGYPDGLRGTQISDLVRLVTICDIFGALMERRPYKAAMSPLQAREILTGMAGKLDKALLAAFDSTVYDC